MMTGGQRVSGVWPAAAAQSGLGALLCPSLCSARWRPCWQPQPSNPPQVAELSNIALEQAKANRRCNQHGLARKLSHGPGSSVSLQHHADVSCLHVSNVCDTMSRYSFELIHCQLTQSRRSNCNQRLLSRGQHVGSAIGQQHAHEPSWCRRLPTTVMNPPLAAARGPSVPGKYCWPGVALPLSRVSGDRRAGHNHRSTFLRHFLPHRFWVVNTSWGCTRQVRWLVAPLVLTNHSRDHV